MEYIEQKLLEEREKRILFQEKLIKKYHMPLISVRVKYPGFDKNNNITRGIIEILDDLLCDMFKYKVHYKLFTIIKEGPMLFFLIEGNPLEIKKTVVKIEDSHTLGTCINVDVYDLNCNIVDRIDIGHKARKCFICDEFDGNLLEITKSYEDEAKQLVKDCYVKYNVSMKSGA